MFIDFRERRREGEGEKHQCERETLIDCHTSPDWGPNPQPRHMPGPESNP